MGETAAHQLARFVHDLRFDDLPDDVVHAGRRVLIDTLGVALGGVASEEARIVRTVARDIDAGDQALIWGTSRRASVPVAAFVNGTTAHAIELDDFGGCDHSGAVIVPTVLGVAEATGGIGGKELITAIVAGYDVARRPMEGVGGYTAHNSHGWHSTGTCGTFGAAAAAGKVLGLDAIQLASAIGIAGSYTGGVWAFIDDGAMSKRLHPGKAAETGVTAAYLARRGFTGPSRIFEAEWGGFLSTYASGEGQVSWITDGLGESFRILKSGIKPYASCRGVHSAIDALLAMIAEHDLRSDDVECVNVYACRFDIGMVGGTESETLLSAQMSLPYGLAVTLLARDASIAQYGAETRVSPGARELVGRIQMVPRDDMTEADEPIVEVRLRGGQVVRNQVAVALGAPENPLTDDALSDKFLSLATAALSDHQARQLLANLWDIADCHDLRSVQTLLSVPVEILS